MPGKDLIKPPEFQKEAPGGLPEGTQACHRLSIPSSHLVPDPNSIDPRRPSLELSLQLGNVPCLKEKCMRWNAERMDCNDNVEVEHQAHMRAALEKIAKCLEDEADDISVPGAV